MPKLKDDIFSYVHLGPKSFLCGFCDADMCIISKAIIPNINVICG
jgi:hypothetical protein